MKIRLLCFAVLLMLGSVAVNAQIGNILNKAKGKEKPKTTQPANDDRSVPPTRSVEGGQTRPGGYKDSEFLLVAANGLAGQGLTKMRACVVGGSDQRTAPPMSELFVSWMNHIDENAALRLYEVKDCQVIAYQIREGDAATKYTSIDSLTETAQGKSIYRVESGRLVLARAVAASDFYIVVVPDHAKPGLKLADLRMCGYPDTISLFKRKVYSGSNCHDQKQKLYVFEKYMSYPGPMQTGSVIFDSAEFNELNKQNKFKGLVVYKLAGEELVPSK